MKFSTNLVILISLFVILNGCQSKVGQNIVRHQQTVNLSEMSAESYESLNASADNKTAGYLVTEGDKQYAVINGKKGKAYQQVALLLFSPKNNRYMYGARIGKKWAMIIDGKRGPLFDAVLGPDFSPDGKKAIYIGETKGKQKMLINGRPGPSFSHIWPAKFSKNSKRMVYMAKQGKKKVIVNNGVISPQYDDLGPLVLSQDGAKVAYRAEKNKKQFVVINNKPGKRYQLIGDPIISPDGRSVAYSAIMGELAQEAVIINNTVGKKFSGEIIKDSLVFSPNGEQVAFVLKEKKKYHVVINGEPGKPFDGIVKDSVTYSPDGLKVAYAGETNVKKMKIKKEIVVVNGDYTSEVYVEAQKLFFSPDSQDFFYIAKNLSEKTVLFKNGKKIIKSDVVLMPAFTDKGDFAYVAGKQGKGLFVVHNNKKHRAYEDIWPITYSQDGEFLYYVGTRGMERFVIVNGHEGKPYTDIINGNILMLSENQLSYSALKKKTDDLFEIIYIEELIEEK